MSTAPSAVNPADIPAKMSRDQIEWWILFTIAVAGKTAKTTEQKMRAFMDLAPDGLSPFERVEFMATIKRLGWNLRKVKLGKYRLLNKGFRQAITLNLDKLEQSPRYDALRMLSTIPGLGPKGSRMILMYAFPEHDDCWVVLDTHILRWLREQGIQAPKSTPPEGRIYQDLENTFKWLAHQRHMSTRQLDTEIWSKYSRK